MKKGTSGLQAQLSLWIELRLADGVKANRVNWLVNIVREHTCYCNTDLSWDGVLN